MGDWVKTAQPCPCGKSSDAYALDSNGNGFCFSGGCSKPFFRNNTDAEEFDSDKRVDEAYPHRGLTVKTLDTYGTKTKIYEGTPLETAFFYPNGSIKARSFAAKKFRTIGDMKNATLFGRNVFDKASKRVITITEGEYDAMSVFQMVGQESAAVSVRSSSSAKLDCKNEYDYINSFEKIVINFDSDEAGQDAAKKVASLFDFKKVFNLSLSKGKDANYYLDKGLVEDYCKAWRGVKRYTPDNILSTWGDFAKALGEKREERIGTYPFEQLQSMLHGLHRGEVVVIKGDEGIGKTELFRAIEDHLLATTKSPLGIIHLEEDNGTTLRGIASYHSKDGSIHPERGVSDTDVLEVVKKATGNDEARIFLHSSFDVEDEDAFTDNIRFLVAGCGCEFVFLDHISWLATATDSSGAGDDERKKLDRISQKLKLLAKELGFCLIMISHVNDDGKTRGSRNITKVANTVIHVSRDKTSSDAVERNKMNMMIEKARLIGAKTGPASYALYDEEALMLVDPKLQALEFPKDE